jgi:nucleotide-binding universal stress UspA family protein
MTEQRDTPPLDGAIVVGVDGSEPSAAALRWATGIAARTGQVVRAIHARPADGPGGADLVGLSDAGDVRVDEIDASPVDALVEASQAPDVALVVVGARGLGAVRGRLLGSVGRHCVRHSARPVVIIHGEPVSLPSRIVVGVDGTPHSQHALGWAIDVALALDGEVVAVHAAGSEVIAIAGTHLRPRFHQEWCQPLRDAGVRHREIFAAGKARDELLRVADRVEADLIVVGTRYDEHERRVVLGSVATHLCENARVPLAVVRRRR